MFNRTALIRTILWTVLALIASLIPIRSFIGGGQSFTAFEFIGPLGGLYLGAVGALAAITTKGTGVLLSGGTLGLFAILRWLTPGAAALYLARQRWVLWIPLIAILVFLVHPVGRSVPGFAMFWLLPFLLWPFREQLWARSLGATFTAHALGGALFIWLVPTTAGLWRNLVPIVIGERLVFAAGTVLAAITIEQLSHGLAAQWPHLRLLMTLKRV